MARKYWPMGKASEIVIKWVSQKKSGRKADTTDWTFETWAMCQEAGIKLHENE
jgi:hypothetical protein